MKKGMSKFVALALIGIFVVSIAAMSAVYVKGEESTVAAPATPYTGCYKAYSGCMATCGYLVWWCRNACWKAKTSCEEAMNDEITQYNSVFFGPLSVKSDEQWAALEATVVSVAEKYASRQYYENRFEYAGFYEIYVDSSAGTHDPLVATLNELATRGISAADTFKCMTSVYGKAEEKPKDGGALPIGIVATDHTNTCIKMVMDENGNWRQAT